MQKPVVPTVNYEKPTTALSIETGDDFIDDIIRNRNRHLNNQANDIKNTLDTVNGLTTVGSAYEAVSGTAASGKPLTWGQRALSAFSAVATPLGVFAKSTKAASPVANAAAKVESQAVKTVAPIGVVAKTATAVDDVGKQLHHFATNKHFGKYTPLFNDILANYKGLHLNQPWNIGRIPHIKGKNHAVEYHEWVLDKMHKIHAVAQGNVAKFVSEFQTRVVKVVTETPKMIYPEHWIQ